MRTKKDLKLSDIPKHNVFQVPEHYFDALPSRVMERTASAAAPATAGLSGVWGMLRLAMAPLLLLLVFVTVYFFSKPAPAPEPASPAISSLAEVAIVDYLTEYNTPLEEADLAELTAFSNQELTAEFLNVSPKAAEEELEYQSFTDQDY